MYPWHYENLTITVCKPLVWINVLFPLLKIRTYRTSTKHYMVYTQRLEVKSTLRHKNKAQPMTERKGKENLRDTEDTVMVDGYGGLSVGQTHRPVRLFSLTSSHIITWQVRHSKA